MVEAGFERSSSPQGSLLQADWQRPLSMCGTTAWRNNLGLTTARTEDDVTPRHHFSLPPSQVCRFIWRPSSSFIRQSNFHHTTLTKTPPNCCTKPSHSVCLDVFKQFQRWSASGFTSRLTQTEKIGKYWTFLVLSQLCYDAPLEWKQQQIDFGDSQLRALHCCPFIKWTICCGAASLRDVIWIFHACSGVWLWDSILKNALLHFVKWEEHKIRSNVLNTQILFHLLRLQRQMPNQTIRTF